MLMVRRSRRYVMQWGCNIHVHMLVRRLRYRSLMRVMYRSRDMRPRQILDWWLRNVHADVLVRW